MAIGIVKIIIINLVSKGFYFLFFFGEILLLMGENGSMLEATAEDNRFCSAALKLLCSV